MQFTLFTLFPSWFDGPLGDSVLRRARDRGIIDVRSVDFRTFATDGHRSVDDNPYGGGGGMVLLPEVLSAALDSTIGPPGAAGRPHTVFLSPRGRPFTQDVAVEFSRLPALALVCGHYEAPDERFLETRIDEELSLGDFVLTGGEIAAMAVVDAVARLLPGVLGNDACAEQDSFMDGLLEGPHYTRPQVFEGRRVPDILLSGNHAAVAEWREQQSLAVTRSRRPDLLARLLLYPDQVRRLARRARPFVVYENAEGSPVRVLFATASVRALPGFPECLRTQRSDRGIHPTTRVAEVKEARLPDPTAERAELMAEAARVLAGKSSEDRAARRFAANLMRAMEDR